VPAAVAPVRDAAALERLTAAADIHDYRHASNPLATGAVPAIPGGRFPARLHQTGPSGVVPLDLSAALKCVGPATTPGLSSNFVRIRAGESVATAANATSQLCFVMRGHGRTRLEPAGGSDALEIPWEPGDLFTLPAGSRCVHEAVAAGCAGGDGATTAAEGAALYWVHDEPLLRYLGAAAVERRFEPTLHRAAAIRGLLDAIAADPSSATANRLSVLLGNRAFPDTQTVSHVLWAMFGLLPARTVQAPHRHQSVAVDLVVDAPPGCYTLVGPRLADDGTIADAERFDWEPHSVFVTPPGLWHSHHNDTDTPAHVLPIQDAGLQTFLRTLDIRFSRVGPDGRVTVTGTAG
jgi:gentisate 1,2-dioxygenase